MYYKQYLMKDNKNYSYYLSFVKKHHRLGYEVYYGFFQDLVMQKIQKNFMVISKYITSELTLADAVAVCQMLDIDLDGSKEELLFKNAIFLPDATLVV